MTAAFERAARPRQARGLHVPGCSPSSHSRRGYVLCPKLGHNVRIPDTDSLRSDIETRPSFGSDGPPADLAATRRGVASDGIESWESESQPHSGHLSLARSAGTTTRPTASRTGRTPPGGSLVTVATIADDDGAATGRVRVGRLRGCHVATTHVSR